MGINLKDARHETEKIIGRGSGFVAVEIPFTPRAKRVLELSLEEARQLGTAFSITLMVENACMPDLLESSVQQIARLSSKELPLPLTTYRSLILPHATSIFRASKALVSDCLSSCCYPLREVHGVPSGLASPYWPKELKYHRNGAYFPQC